MTHLTLTELLALRDNTAEPGLAAAAEHLKNCDRCTAEMDRLHQRVARLRALPALRPRRDAWPGIVETHRGSIRRQTLRRTAVVAGALAASLVAVALVRPFSGAPADDADVTAQAIAEAQAQSAALEATIGEYNPATRPIDGATARSAQALEDRIAEVDQQLQQVELTPTQPASDRQALDLWNQRVGLLDALVDVHLASAGNVGL